MPSSEDCINAQNEIRELAIQQLVKEGHPQKSAEMIVKNMRYDEQIRLAEKLA